MKNTLKLIISLLIFLFSYSYTNAQVQQPNLSTEIVGSWIAENDNNYKLVFTQDGHMKTYLSNVLSSDFIYSITTQCNGQILNANYDIFLKLTDTEDNDTYCNFLNGIHTGNSGIKTLSIRTESGKLSLYTKQ
ncbi:MAG TPA: hypothetical protein PKC62_11980 [Ferruginibacter sp.]|jgi:hypothetical protein|nr:hypothetical protein [Bacteroidota bacterium]HMT97399.1 hypothetical protein [Ferruginibacter sp.]HMU25701.1 hypothetical protein [Ferruginibacter sp.]HRD43439.1 hypothetical protein [Ferruginibacter sp.]